MACNASPTKQHRNSTELLLSTGPDLVRNAAIIVLLQAHRFSSLHLTAARFGIEAGYLGEGYRGFSLKGRIGNDMSIEGLELIPTNNSLTSSPKITISIVRRPCSLK